jgi:hypothetical protein
LYYKILLIRKEIRQNFLVILIRYIEFEIFYIDISIRNIDNGGIVNTSSPDTHNSAVEL